MFINIERSFMLNTTERFIMPLVKQLEACTEALAKSVPFKAVVCSEDNDSSNVNYSLVLNDDLVLAIYWFNASELTAVSTSLSKFVQSLQEKVLLRSDRNQIVAASYIRPRLATQLRENGIQYMDAAGNAFINSSNYHVVIVGQKPPLKLAGSTMVKTKVRGDDEKTGKAFQPSGLKVIYSLLTDPTLANKSLRNIANQSGVSLGSVSAIQKDLIAHGYLQKVNKKFELKHRSQLIARWAEVFPYLVRNKMHLGQFTSDNIDWWQSVDSNMGIQLSGEVAASLLSNYLQPKDGIVYATKDALKMLMKAARLRQLKEGEQPIFKIDVYEPFWTIASDKLVAPELIVYSDLLSNNDPRNEAAARRLYDEYLT